MHQVQRDVHQRCASCRSSSTLHISYRAGLSVGRKPHRVERSVSFIPTISRDLREALEQPCGWAKVIFCATMTALHPGILHVDGKKTRCAHGQAECPPRCVKI